MNEELQPAFEKWASKRRREIDFVASFDKSGMVRMLLAEAWCAGAIDGIDKVSEILNRKDT